MQFLLLPLLAPSTMLPKATCAENTVRETSRRKQVASPVTSHFSWGRIWFPFRIFFLSVWECWMAVVLRKLPDMSTY